MSSNPGDARRGIQKGAQPEQGEASDRKSLPFEPKRRKTEPTKGQSIRSALSTKPSADSGIPQVVSQRMARRMAIFCGVPTALGMLTFVVSYWFVSQDLVNLPTYAVLLVSLGWFGLGVLGLTYGVLSASWEEEETGTRLGIAEFRTNLGRTTSAWRENAEKAKAARISQAAPDKADKKS